VSIEQEAAALIPSRTLVARGRPRSLEFIVDRAASGAVPSLKYTPSRRSITCPSIPVPPIGECGSHKMKEKEKEEEPRVKRKAKERRSRFKEELTDSIA
jgi:hypothetical protein